jgi:hypothetical protein
MPPLSDNIYECQTVVDKTEVKTGELRMIITGII